MRDQVAALLPFTFRDDAGEIGGMLHTKRERLVSWDFSFVRAVLMREEGITEEEAVDRQAEYLVWMENILMGRKNPPITKSCDSFWHCAIICTRDYEKFCKQVMGRFIHHEPLLKGNKKCHGAGSACSSSNDPTCGV